MKIKSTAHKKLRDAKSEEQKIDAKHKFTAAKTQLQKLERFNATRNEVERDEKLHTIITSNPKLLFKEIKTKKSGSKTMTEKLYVGNTVYTGADVADGFFHSISALKARDSSSSSSKS